MPPTAAAGSIPCTRFSMPFLGIGIIITPDARRFARKSRNVLADGVTQEHLFEARRSRDPRARESQDLRAESADRPRCNFEHEDSVRADAALRVDRSVRSGRGRQPRAAPDRRPPADLLRER